MTGQTIHYPIALGAKLWYWRDTGEPYTVVSLMANDRGQQFMIIERGADSHVLHVAMIGALVFSSREEAQE